MSGEGRHERWPTFILEEKGHTGGGNTCDVNTKILAAFAMIFETVFVMQLQVQGSKPEFTPTNKRR